MKGERSTTVSAPPGATATPRWTPQAASNAAGFARGDGEPCRAADGETATTPCRWRDSSPPAPRAGRARPSAAPPAPTTLAAPAPGAQRDCRLRQQQRVVRLVIGADRSVRQTRPTPAGGWRAARRRAGDAARRRPTRHERHAEAELHRWVRRAARGPGGQRRHVDAREARPGVARVAPPRTPRRCCRATPRRAPTPPAACDQRDERDEAERRRRRDAAHHHAARRRGRAASARRAAHRTSA